MNVSSSHIQQFINQELVQLPVLLINDKITVISGVTPEKTVRQALKVADKHMDSFLRSNAVVTPFSRLSAKLAKTWLLEHDSEGAEIWNATNDKAALVGAVKDNLVSFGLKNQHSTKCYITSNNPDFSNYGTNGAPSH